ncbi:Mitochondrial distribution and morphology protein 35 [Dinochytrium kinnereticum]|nr:Mitochondrial distribution and morphology protein 35 [Dinochytrium kinnereticum]
MASISPECLELKQQYDACFNKWYSEKFLKGKGGEDCEILFKKYRGCVWTAIKEKNIDKLINDARRENPFKGNTSSTDGSK